MKKVIIYIRVSTSDQVEGYSIGEQKERLIAFCRAKGWAIIEVIIDGGFSGSDLERPGISKVITMAKNKEADIVLVDKLDRLSRSQKDTLYLIEDVFLPHDVDFVSVHESFDTGTPSGKFMISILSAFAQLERERIKERTFDGRIGRSKKGLWHGGGTDPIGYHYEEGELIIDPEEAQQVRSVFELFAAGNTLTMISEQMAGYTTKHGDWSNTGTISTVLSNPLYAGIIHFDGNLSPGSHVPIISEDLFNVVQKIRERIKWEGSRIDESNPNSLLYGLIFCKRCGARYFARTYHSGNSYYCCYSRAKVNKRMIKDPDCKNENILTDDLINHVQLLVEEFVKDPLLMNKMRAQKKGLMGEHKALDDTRREELEDIDRQIGRLLDAYQFDHEGQSYEDISQRLKLLYEKKARLTTAIHPERREYDIGALKLLLNNTRLRLCDWDSVSFNEKREVICGLIHRIEIDGGNVDILWSFM